MTEAPHEQLAGLVTEARHPDYADLDVWPTQRIVERMAAEEANVHCAVAAAAPAIAAVVDATAERLARGGRLIYVGAGTAGRVGVLDAVECRPTFNTPPGQVMGILAGRRERGGGAMVIAEEDGDEVERAEDDADAGAAAVADVDVGLDDVVIGITASGRTPFVLGAVAAAAAAGALTVGIACNPARR
ncbi:hypothetical protein BH20ACT8_BH20ACT8_13450 [soil metagenome]